MIKYLSLLFFVTYARANETNFSLFLTRQECATFNRQTSTLLSSASDNLVKLNALMYLNETNWSIWINNEKITPDDEHEYIQIKTVTDEFVEFIWMTDHGAPTIKLWVNESIDLTDLK